MTVSYTNTSGMHSPRPADGKNINWLRIERVPTDLRNEAIERLVSNPDNPSKDAARRFLDFAAEHKVRLDYMWAVFDSEGRSIRRTLLAVPSPGRTAMVFTTRLYRDEEISEAGLLIQRAMDDLQGSDIHLAQVLLDPRDDKERHAYIHGGFIELAHLSYMERLAPSGRDVQPIDWPNGVTIEHCRDPHDPEWAEVLDRTYEQTLDCPGLLGLRQTHDIIEGHRSIGAFDPKLWTMLRMNGRGAGVLLLNPVPASRSVELVYLGLAPEARGKGLASRLLHYGLGLLVGRPERTVTLAVDDRNTPAIKLYHAHGFRRSLRRVALVRPLTGKRTGGASDATT